MLNGGGLLRKAIETFRALLIGFLIIGLCGNFKYVMAVETTVKVAFVGVDHSPLVEGDTESFYLTSMGAKKVKYRVFLQNINLNKTEEITNGYTEVVDGTKPYIVRPNQIFKLGKYKLIVWVKGESSVKTYDSVYIANLNCVNRDDNNRVYSSGDIDITRDVYTVGEKVLVGGIKDISGMKGPYTYKLHVYDTEANEWILDDKGFRNNLEWVPTKPGTYVLVVWDMSYNSTLWKALITNPEKRLYEGWKLKVITVKDTTKNVEVSFVGVGHSPLVAGEKERFYLTSKYAEKVQYRAWIYSDNTKTWEDITNGYTPMVDADNPYEITPDKKFWVGKYKLWIWVREEKSLKEYDNYFVSYLNCVTKDDSNRVYTINDMDVEKSIFKVGEKVIVRGIKDISGMAGPYTYKLHIFNTKTGEWTKDNKEYRGLAEWIPTVPGTYVLDLWTMSANSTLWKLLKINPTRNLYEGWKLKVIKVVPEGYNGTEVEQVKPYTEVISLPELYTAIEKNYDVIINDAKVAAVYEKAKDIISSVTNSSMSELEKELAIHEYVVKNTAYDFDNYINERVPEDSYTAYGTLINGKAVCQGYADTMKLLLNLAGIEAQVVVGYAGEPHAWNMVKIDGEYYHLDATWDDPVPDAGNKVRYTYFNVSDEQISKDHEWNRKNYVISTSKEFNYLQSMYHAVIDSPWIYFSNELDGYKLYKMSLDGKVQAKLNNSDSRYGAIDEQWIYYSNYSYGGFLYKVRKDGLGTTRLNNEWSKDIVVQDDWILYKSVKEDKLYKVRKDGTERQLAN
jgi:transglutaminase-like putative cysteine protease